MSLTLRNTLIGTAVFVAMVAVGNGVIKPGLARVGWLGGNQPSATAPELLPTAPNLAVRQERAAGARPSARPARTLLLIDGAAGPVAADAPVALPQGSRFSLLLRSAEAADVEIRAVAPDGHEEAAPLWQGSIVAQGSVETPKLRLTGMTGMETLRVVRRSLRDGQVTEEQVRLLHR